ncbi:Smr/MutS family protein [Actinacidiphila rubida]|uniref:Smr domain-containing protein n=1 Tax=Actinacidiphila rubida TaxID=310780 RepID=A0A1H8QII2_9ACTN|nr:Smr/MutS family protein [Actinacidiphila rubida]SEO54055.1 Smr domain-containing protein [Actinacidiphila rubida]
MPPGPGIRRQAGPRPPAVPRWPHDRAHAPGRGVRCNRTPPGPGPSEAIALITLDLHPIFRNNRDIDLALRETLFRAARTGEDVIEIIPGKGTGQLKKRVLAFLAQKHIKKLYLRVETDATNTGRVLVRLK